jgi:hypothetical protein
MTAHQLPLFTAEGRPYSPDLARIDLRMRLFRELARIFGESRPAGCNCPSCGGAVAIVLHPTAPTAYCPCGWHMGLQA